MEYIGEKLRTLRLAYPFSLLLLALTVAACSPAALASLRSTRPVAKIALIAPFEGLYRQNGYEALDALRLALAESPATHVDLLPLALDDSADPLRTERSVRKVLADPETVAVVGPLTPATTAAVAPLFARSAVRWYAPLRVDPGGAFAAPASDAWAEMLIAEIAAAAHTQGASRLLAVQSPGWPELSALEADALELPLLVAADASAAEAQYARGDALLWLGSPYEGAVFLNKLRAVDEEAIFWMGPQGGDPVFAAHADFTARVFWAIWTDDAYNHASQADSTFSPSAYLVYRAAQTAVATAEGRQSVSDRGWHIAFYRFGVDGTSSLWTPESSASR